MRPEKTTFWKGPAVFILPSLLVYIIFMILPLVGTLTLSFTQWDGISYENIKFIGLRNYEELFFRDHVFWLALKNNLIFIAASVLIQCTLGLVMALMLEQKLFGGNVFRGSYFMPAIISLIVIGIVFESILNPSLGVLDKLLMALGLESLTGLGHWLGKSNKAIWVLIIMQVWYGFGWSMFIFISRLKTINPQLYEAARIDGASELQRVFYITIPQLKGVTAIAILFAAMWAMKIFTLPYVVTKGGPNHATEVLATWAFSHGLSYQHVGYGSAIAVMLIIFGMVMGFIIFKMTNIGKVQ